MLRTRERLLTEAAGGLPESKKLDPDPGMWSPEAPSEGFRAPGSPLNIPRTTP